MKSKHKEKCKSFLDGFCEKCERRQVNIIYSKQVWNCEHLLGTFLDKQHYDILIESDTDFYAPSLDGSMTEDNIVFKYRKNVFNKEECDLAYKALRNAASESHNRGMAAGLVGNDYAVVREREWVTEYQQEIIDWFLRNDNALIKDETLEDIRNRWKDKKPNLESRGLAWLKNKIKDDFGKLDNWFDNYIDDVYLLPKRELQKEAINFLIDNYMASTSYSQAVHSGIAGYFGRYPRIPYGRACAYNDHDQETFKLCFPYLKKLNNCFKELLPNRWQNQRICANKIDPRFLINDTVFTTLTVNFDFRTGAHRDAGDLSEGFSNICPIGSGWHGAEFILPEYKVALNLQPGDLLLVANHTGIHANAPFIGEGNDRVSIVAYFREDMLELGSWEYEQTRKSFIESRRKNENHPLWHPLWNGISVNCFKSQEWYDYLKNQPKGQEMLMKYHPETNKSSLEKFLDFE